MSPQKKKEFFKDVSSGWRSRKKVKEESKNIQLNEVEILEGYKKFCNYMMEQCGIDDLRTLSEEDLGQFFTLANEAFLVMNELMQKPGEGYDKGIVQGYGRQTNPVHRRMRKAQTGAAMMNPNTKGDDLRTFNVRGQTRQLPKRI